MEKFSEVCYRKIGIDLSYIRTSKVLKYHDISNSEYIKKFFRFLKESIDKEYHKLHLKFNNVSVPKITCTNLIMLSYYYTDNIKKEDFLKIIENSEVISEYQFKSRKNNLNYTAKVLNLDNYIFIYNRDNDFDYEEIILDVNYF